MAEDSPSSIEETSAYVAGVEDLSLPANAFAGLRVVDLAHDALVLNPSNGRLSHLGFEEGRRLERIRRDAACLIEGDALLVRRLFHEELFAARTEDIIAPRSVMIEPADGCDLSCPACYRSGSFSGRFMADAWFDEAVRFLAAYPAAAVTISGGECTLHPDIEGMVGRIARLPNPIQIVTTGARLSDGLLDICRDARIRLTVSLDAPSAAADAVTRDPRSFPRVLQTLSRAAGRGVSTKANVVVTRGNAEALEEILSFLRGHGVRAVDFLTYFHSRPSGYSQARVEVDSVMRALVPLQLRNPDIVIENVGSFHLRPRWRARSHCCAGRQFIDILPRRRVRACPLYGAEDTVPEGMPLLEYFRSPGKAWAALRAASVDDCAECAACDLRYLCGGGCPARTFDGSPEGRCPEALIWSVLSEHVALEAIYSKGGCS